MQKAIMVLAVIAAVALGVLNLTYEPGLKPDAVYAMANQHIEWTYAGK